MITLINRLRKAQGGFTLIELLVVVAIIALLATFAVPKLFDAINKSKKAPGQADLNTISSALERHYFDNTEYPNGTDADDIMTALKGGYVKSGTTFVNGFGKGYVYFSNAAGSFYVVVDPRNYSGDLYVKCGTTTPWTSPVKGTAADDTFYYAIQTSEPDSDDLNGGCKVYEEAAATTEITDVGIVTN